VTVEATTPLGRRERKKRETRERIYESARLLFLEQGFANTTVEQISEAADVAQTTFFNHFASKDALLHQMSGEVSERLEAMLAEQLAHPGSACARIRRFAAAVVEGLSQARVLAREILLDLMRATSAAGEAGEALPYLAGVYQPFSAILRAGQKAGDVRDDLDPQRLAEMVIGTLHMALVGWLNDSDYPFDERLGELVDLICSLITPPGGPAAGASLG